MAVKRTMSGVVAFEHYWSASGVYNNPIEITSDQCNLNGFLAENDHTSAIYFQFFDSAGPASSIVVGTSVPDFVVKVPAGAVYGKDVQEVPIHHFDAGMWIAATSSRFGSGAPGASGYMNLWYWDKK